MHSRGTGICEAGFTLVELLVVISIAAILASIAVPSLRTTMQNNQLDTISNQLVATLANARSEAVRVPDGHVFVNNAPLGTQSTTWTTGWITTVLMPPPAITVTLQAPTPAPGQVSVISHDPGPIGFDPMGRLIVGTANPLASLVFMICADPAAPAVNQSRAVIVSPSGRASVAHIGKIGAGLGLPLDDKGTAISSCTQP